MRWSPLAVERAFEAATWLDGLFAITDRLEQFPESGRIVPEIGLPEYREVIYRRAYRVIYRIENKRVAILTVRSCAEAFDERDARRLRR